MDHKDREPESVDIADFPARWPEIVEGFGNGAMFGVDVTKNGQVIAVIRRPAAPLHGYLRGSVRLPDDVDLTKPIFEDETNAERGRITNDTLVATARRLVVPIVTRDRLILAYASLGHVDAIAC